MTLQLRYLQTLTEIGVEKNTTIVFPLPIELLSMLNKFSRQIETSRSPRRRDCIATNPTPRRKSRVTEGNR